MLIRYFILAGLMHLIDRKSKRPPLGQNPSESLSSSLSIKRDIYWSEISTFIFAIAGTVLFELWNRGYTRIYLDTAQYGYAYLILSFPLLLVIQDSYFYWTHRLLHRGKIFQKFHSTHHASRYPTAWTSFSFHPIEACVQALIVPVIFVLIPIHLGVLVLFLMTMSLFGIFNHLGHEFLPSFLEKKWGVITATHHHVHHQKVSKNFGLFFNFWDRLMNTEAT